jgi:hypothetical protein
VHRIGAADAALADVPHHAHLAAFADHLLSAPARAA